MKKKMNLIKLSKDEMTKKEKSKVLGGYTALAKPGFLGCCCSGHGMVNSWNNVRR